MTDVSHWCPLERHLTPRGGGGVHPIMVYSGQVPPERGTFSRIHSVYERVEILLVELYFSSLKRLKTEGQQTHLMSFTWL